MACQLGTIIVGLSMIERAQLSSCARRIWMRLGLSVIRPERIWQVARSSNPKNYHEP